MNLAAPTLFDPAAFLANVGLGRRIVELQPKEAFFSQGYPADSVFYLQKGRQRSLLFRRLAKKRRSPCSHGCASMAVAASTSSR